MLKKTILSFIGRRKKKAEKNSRTCSFSSANSIGVLINGSNPEPSNLLGFLDQFKLSGKSIHVLGINTQKVNMLQNINSTVGKDDFSVLGAAQSDVATAFVHRHYDFLILLDQSGDYLLRHIAKMCKATYLIGLSDFPDSQLLTLQVKPRVGYELEDLFKYIQMIED